MSHKTLIGGTAYEISGGKTLVDGTAYSIKSGKTLVGGTVYEVGFAPSEATVTITGSGSYSAIKPGVCYVSIDGVNYSSQTTVVVPIGTVVACTVGTMAKDLSEGCVKVNGNTVLTAESGKRVTYDYTVNGNVTLNLKTERNADKDVNGYITITEQ